MAPPPDGLAEISQLSYEQARTELVELVHKMESGQVPLAETIGLWERAEALAAHCRSWLDDAQARLEATIAAQSTEAQI